MWKWYKRQNTNVKLMVILVVVLTVGVAVRWRYVAGEGGKAFRERFRIEKRTPLTGDSAGQADSLNTRQRLR